MNKISLVGRITKDPEISNTTSNIMYCRFNVACKSKIKDENGDPQVDFFICVAWRDKAKLIDEYCSKGDMVQVMGSMASRYYDAQDGSRKMVWEVNVEDVEFLTPKSEKETQAPKGSKTKSTKQKSEPAQPDLTPIDEDDDDLPF